MRSALILILGAVGFVLGIALFIAGGADDSPGLQGIGALVGIAAVLAWIRSARNARAGGRGGKPDS